MHVCLQLVLSTRSPSSSFSFCGVGRCAAQSRGVRSTKVKWVYSEMARQLPAPPSSPNLPPAIYLWTSSTFLKIAFTIRFPNCTPRSLPLSLPPLFLCLLLFPQSLFRSNLSLCHSSVPVNLPVNLRTKTYLAQERKACYF